MVFDDRNGTQTAGQADVIGILKNTTTGRFHAAFFDEQSILGPMESIIESDVLQLRINLHHTEGAVTLEDALVHLQEIVEHIIVPETNIWKEPIDWDGNLGTTWMLPNWLKKAENGGK